jgi:signal transduction histidine kinase
MAEPGSAKWRLGLEDIQRQLVDISSDVHSLSRRLHSATLDDLGLIAAIEGECRGFFERGGPPVNFQHSDYPQPLNKDVQLAIYRIVQEALRNIYRHADASEVRIDLNVSLDFVSLEIEDDGLGSAWPGLATGCRIGEHERTSAPRGRRSHNSRPSG